MVLPVAAVAPVEMRARRGAACPHLHRRSASPSLGRGSPVQRRVRPLGVVQPSARAPTGPSPVGCFIAGIPGTARLVRVRDVVEKAGIARARCALDGAAPDLWQEVPLWMFDRVACAGMRIEPRARVDVTALSALASLVSGALGKSVASRAGWISDDQDRGESHARSTQGASQAQERIGATRSVRPGGEQQSGGHAGVARASGPYTPEGDRADGPADAGPRARSWRSGSGSGR